MGALNHTGSMVAAAREGLAGASAVEPVGDGRWRGEIRTGWDIAGNANGGYLLATAVRALSQASELPDPVSVTAHYLRPGRPGPVEVETEVLRAGRSFTTARAVLRAEKPLLALLGSFADLSQARRSVERVDAAPPKLPAVDDCMPMVSPPGPPFMNEVDLRLHPEDANFITQPSGEPRVRGWFRLRDDEPIDTTALLVAVDAFPPTVFNARLPIAWTPTLELTAHVRARPEPGWLRCAFSTRFITGGFLEADGEVWDESGALVAQSRQLALLPRG
jgi:acyl-CoA thioesterase